MKNSNTGNATKIIAGVIIGIMLIFMVGIVANGWQTTDINGENSGEDGDITDNADNQNGDTEDGTADNNIIIEEPEIPQPPQFTSYLTGLEISEEFDNQIPYALVVEPNAPLYGISGSELTVEIPTEDGNTRFLVYKTDISDLGKIGAITSTRDYISQMVKFFGGALVAYGNDDIVSYTSIPSGLQIDLSEHIDSIYKENGKNIYTDNQNLIALTKDEGIDLTSYKTQNIPFIFCDYFETVSGQTCANSIIIPYSESNETQLQYDSLTNAYILAKDGRNKVDMINGENASYTNVFILFSDMITYEMSSGTETIVDTAGKGTGYYVTGGALTEIRWSVDSNGTLIFKNLNGDILTVNRGNSYIGYYKSADSNAVIFE